METIGSGEPVDPLIGATLGGRFRILRRLGAGGMGVVYEATHEVIGRRLAIKVLHDKYAAEPEVVERLVNEARLASSVCHENIVDVFDVGETADGRPFVVMERLDGESLAQRLAREGPLEERKVARLGRQIAGALGAAHALGIVHRDVKPENVFLVQRDGADFAKVVDFGISKALRVGPDGGLLSPRLTQTGMILGTPLYMSPEQARGEEGLDQRIDIYALGVILYECLTGQVPFQGSNYLGILSRILTETPVPPRERRPAAGPSESMERVVMRAMAKSRDERYPTMTDLATDLERVLEGRTVAPLPKSGKRSRRGWIILCGGLGLLAIGLALQRRAPTPRATLLPAPAAAVPPRPLDSVVVKIRSSPPGAEIREGARRLGIAPATLELARSDRPVHLTFLLEGYEDGATDLVPKIDGETVDIELRPRRVARPRPKVELQAGTSEPPVEPLPAANPYHERN